MKYFRIVILSKNIRFLIEIRSKTGHSVKHTGMCCQTRIEMSPLDVHGYILSCPSTRPYFLQELGVDLFIKSVPTAVLSAGTPANPIHLRNAGYFLMSPRIDSSLSSIVLA